MKMVSDKTDSMAGFVLVVSIGARNPHTPCVGIDQTSLVWVKDCNKLDIRL